MEIVPPPQKPIFPPNRIIREDGTVKLDPQPPSIQKRGGSVPAILWVGVVLAILYILYIVLDKLCVVLA